MAVHHQLSEPQNLSAQMESVTETRLLPFLEERKPRTDATIRVKQLQCGQSAQHADVSLY